MRARAFSSSSSVVAHTLRCDSRERARLNCQLRDSINNAERAECVHTAESPRTLRVILVLSTPASPLSDEKREGWSYRDPLGGETHEITERDGEQYAEYPSIAARHKTAGLLRIGEGGRGRGNRAHEKEALETLAAR